jgi:hypothetical protein
MPITFDRDPEIDLTTFTLSGIVPLGEFIEALDEYGSGWSDPEGALQCTGTGRRSVLPFRN